MKHGSLFSGIGGFDLAAEWMGWENKFHCEWNEFGQRVLKYYWPEAESYGDITTTDFTIWNGRIDILTGGFPCQPYSQAGKRLGKEDERHLWPEMLRAIKEIKPRWVVGENVYGIVNWNGGMVFEEVQAQLEDEGYQVQPYILPAAAVNAPHRRDRVWFVAYADMHGHESRGFEENRSAKGAGEIERNQRKWVRNDGGGNGKPGITSNSGLQRPEKRQKQSVGVIELCKERDAPNTDSSSKGSSGACSKTESHRCENNDEPKSWGKQAKQHTGCSHVLRSVTNTDSGRLPFKKHREAQTRRITKKGVPNDWKNFPTQSPVCSGNDGIPTELDGITFPKWRNESIKAYGNAIVPQVALQIFKAIEEYEKPKRAIEDI